MFTVGAGQGVSVSQDPAVKQKKEKKKEKKLLLNKMSPGMTVRKTSAACLERAQSHAASAFNAVTEALFAVANGLK